MHTVKSWLTATCQSFTIIHVTYYYSCNLHVCHRHEFVCIGLESTRYGTCEPQHKQISYTASITRTTASSLHRSITQSPASTSGGDDQIASAKDNALVRERLTEGGSFLEEIITADYAHMVSRTIHVEHQGYTYSVGEP